MNKMNKVKALTIQGQILVVLLSFSFMSMVQAEQQSETAKKYSIDQAVNSFDASKTNKTKVGYQYWFADKNFANGKTLKMSVVAPHKSTHAPHKHIEDEFFFVLEGTAEFFLEGETRIAGPMTSFYCPSWQMHGIKNIGDTELKYLVIKKYQQTKK
ncbi:MAG: cupin domain-containing protein [Colwellia sp.]